MAKETRKQSAVGTFGSIVIALGLVLGFIMSDITVAAAGIGAGIFILLIAVIVDRLDIIIDLLRQICENQPTSSTDNDSDKTNQ